MREQVGALPFILCLNKADLRDQWEIDLDLVAARAREDGWVVIETSAKLGVGVEEAFSTAHRAHAVGKRDVTRHGRRLRCPICSPPSTSS